MQTRFCIFQIAHDHLPSNHLSLTFVIPASCLPIIISPHHHLSIHPLVLSQLLSQIFHIWKSSFQIQQIPCCSSSLFFHPLVLEIHSTYCIWQCLLFWQCSSISLRTFSFFFFGHTYLSRFRRDHKLQAAHYRLCTFLIMTQRWDFGFNDAELVCCRSTHRRALMLSLVLWMWFLYTSKFFRPTKATITLKWVSFLFYFSWSSSTRENLWMGTCRRSSARQKRSVLHVDDVTHWSRRDVWTRFKR